jgi:hypothetical protein
MWAPENIPRTADPHLDIPIAEKQGLQGRRNVTDVTFHSSYFMV